MEPTPPPRTGGRAAVLAALRLAAAPLSAAEIGERAGLHLNTARFHLDKLVEAGEAVRTDAGRGTPGRPRALYAAVGEHAGVRSYPLLAEMLAGLVAGLPDGPKLASAAGRVWGAHLVERPPPATPVDAAEATARVVRLLDGIGFRPDAVPLEGPPPGAVQLRLGHCPFREVAERHPDVVCGMHLALIQGALAELRAPLRASGLEPFAEPDLCLARLSPVPRRARKSRAGVTEPPTGGR